MAFNGATLSTVIKESDMCPGEARNGNWLTVRGARELKRGKRQVQLCLMWPMWALAASASISASALTLSARENH